MNFESFFNPKSVAMVGVSHHKGKVGYEILANMIAAGYEGEIFPVNPQADAIERQGLTFAELSHDTIARLASNLPAAASLQNPVDVLCDALADRYEFALSTALDDPNVDIALVLLTPQAMTDPIATAEGVVKIAQRKPGKLILACFLGASKMEEGTRILREGKIPCYDSPETAVNTIKAMTEYVRWRSRPKRIVELFPVNRRKTETTIEKHLRHGTFQIGEVASKEILEAYGFAIPKASVATTSEQAANIARQLGFPVVLKIWSPQIVHKTDVGGVKLGLGSPEEVMDAFDLMLYSLSKKSIQTRYMTHTMTFAHKDVQQLTNIDYSRDISIVGTVPGISGEQIVALAQYFLDPKTQAAEVAFIVQDEWQQKGMGTFLLDYITKIAEQRGVKRFYAEVLPINKPMLAVFCNSGYDVSTEFDGEVYSIKYDLNTQEQKE